MDKIIKESLDKIRLIEKQSVDEDWKDWAEFGDKVVKGGKNIAGSIGQSLKRGVEHPGDVVKGIGQSAIDIAKDSGATMGAGYAAGKAASKVLGKKIPGVGTALYGKDAYDRFKSGDYTGAALQGAGAVASLIPGIGTAAALGIDAATAAKDYASSEEPESDDIESIKKQLPKLQKDADIDIAILQQQFKNAGEDIDVTGFSSPELISLLDKYNL